MADLKEYIARNGEGGQLAVEAVDELLKRYEWFSTARIVREHLTGKDDELLKIVCAGRTASSLKRLPIDIAKLLNREPVKASTDEIIDKFLQFGDYRIVADGDSADNRDDIRTEAEFSDEDDIVSEELAEIYLSQGLKSEALAIYRKLSLLNTEKSVYFAEIIDKIENNN